MQQRDDNRDLHTEVAGLRAEIAALSAARRPWHARLARPRGFRRSGAIGLLALMLALPVAVSASHQFSDVSTSNTFHTSISRLYGARMTGGCAATRFCPDANVTRGQMAAFLVRGLPRAGGDAGVHDFDDDWGVFETGVLAVVDLQGGGSTGGTGLVLAHGDVTAYTDEAGVCPCEVRIGLVNVDTGEESPIMNQIIGTEPSPAHDDIPAYYETTVSVSYLFTVPSGATNTYVLYGELHPTLAPSPENDAAVEVSMSAAYIPFDAVGSNPTLPTTSGSGWDSPRD